MNANPTAFLCLSILHIHSESACSRMQLSSVILYLGILNECRCIEEPLDGVGHPTFFLSMIANELQANVFGSTVRTRTLLLNECCIFSKGSPVVLNFLNPHPELQPKLSDLINTNPFKITPTVTLQSLLVFRAIMEQV